MFHKARLPEFRPDPEAAYGRMVGELPDGPELLAAQADLDRVEVAADGRDSTIARLARVAEVRR